MGLETVVVFQGILGRDDGVEFAEYFRGGQEFVEYFRGSRDLVDLRILNFENRYNASEAQVKNGFLIEEACIWPSANELYLEPAYSMASRGTLPLAPQITTSNWEGLS